MRKFLTAQWQDLVMANYIVEPVLLEKRLPNGVELDLYHNECYVSLVAFKFADTKVLGVPIPFHINFEEINLRFYVKRTVGDEVKRGVCFVKEIVPRGAISFVARTVYGEPYETWKTNYQESENEMTYGWSKGAIKNRVHVEFSEEIGVPSEDSHESFIIEHYWGYTKRSKNATDEYKVVHPKWSLFEVNYAEIEVDFGKTYGEEFSFLSDAEPKSILLAEGSEVSVFQGERLKISEKKK